jgi:hypothetical protein
MSNGSQATNARIRKFSGVGTYRGGRMTKLTNCSIMAPRASGSTYAAPRQGLPKLINRGASRLVFLPEFRPASADGTPPTHSDQRKPWLSRLGSARGASCPARTSDRSSGRLPRIREGMDEEERWLGRWGRSEREGNQQWAVRGRND